MDGEWEAPQIPNPACETAPGCGEWKRPKINNPQYKGKWKAPLVDNPNYQVTITRPAALEFNRVLFYYIRQKNNFPTDIWYHQSITLIFTVDLKTSADLFLLIVFLHILRVPPRESGSHVRSIIRTILRTCSHSGWHPSRLWAWSCGPWPQISTLTTSLSPLKRRWPTAGPLTAGGWRNWWPALMRSVRCFNRHFHCHCVHVISHKAVCFLWGKVSQMLTISSCSLVPCLFSPAGDFRSADDCSRGTTVALGDLHTDSWPACRTDCALLLAKGTVHPMT